MSPGDLRAMESAATDLSAYQRIGAWVRAARQDLGLSQTELGQALGTSRSVVANWERNQFVPGQKSCQLLAGVFGVPVDEIVELVQHTKSRAQTLGVRASAGHNRDPLKELVKEPDVKRPSYGSCDVCGREGKCRARVGRGLPLLCGCGTYTI